MAFEIIPLEVLLGRPLPGYVAAIDHCAHVPPERLIKIEYVGCGAEDTICPLCGANQLQRAVLTPGQPNHCPCGTH